MTRGQLRGILGTLLLTSACLAQQPQFDGLGLKHWRKQALEHNEEAVTKLAAGKERCLPVLRALLAVAPTDKNEAELAATAAKVCRQLGPEAESLSDQLLQHLQKSCSWLTQYRCGQALASIGVAKPEIVHALLHHIGESDVPALRAYCAESLAELCPKAPSILLAAVTSGRLSTEAFAIDALVRIGPSVAPELLAELAKPTSKTRASARRVAEEGLARLGWQVVTLLEKHGHAKLAQRALREGLLVRELDIDSFQITGPAPQPPVQRMPRLQWSDGSGHGQGLTLYRAVEDKRGLRIDHIATYLDESDTRRVSLQTAVLPRAKALEATRQLAAIATMNVSAKSEPPTWVSSGNISVSIQMELEDKLVLSESFSGYITGDNFPERFLAHAAVVVLRQATNKLDWTERPITEEDRKFLEERAAASSKEPWWVKDRLDVMTKALKN